MADFPMVGIGSSAGGLEALQQLLKALPPDPGFALIVAAHLDPTQESHLTELLSRCTKMPVVEIAASIEVEPDHVYVIAPDQELTIRHGVIHANKPNAPRGHRHPVDSFFRSLAEDQGDRAIAIILSGTGTNGSLGLRFVKDEGGIVIAQDPETAGFAGMPRSAISTGIVDLVLPPDQMPEALLNISRHPYVRQAAKVADEAPADDQLGALLTLVRAKTRQDFSAYRKRTLLRRTHRRMGLHRIEGLANYIERLRHDPDEIEALAADLTINVTGFFRDPEAWQTLSEKVLAPLVRERPSGSAIRAWVPGCSTGEEAYTIAILPRTVLECLLPAEAEVVDDLGRWYIRHIVPYRTATDRIDGVVVTFTEITERKRREREVEEAKEFAEAIVGAVRFPLVVLTPQLRVISANPAFYETFQVTPDETEGRPLQELGNRQWDIPELRQRLATVLPESLELADFEIEHEFERIGQRAMLLHARPLGGAQLILLGMVDLTERRRNERERELLMRELSHRVKNILAVVRALATQTDHSQSVEEFRETFVGRLSALARAHSLLLDAEWRGGDLGELVQKSVEAYRVDRPDVIQIEGEPAPIAPSQGVGLSLILHELGTNAAKYGGLSHPDGRVHVSWRIEQGDGGRRVRLVWQERGGPSVEPPAEKGFGTRLIERAGAYELEGQVELNYAPDGLRCEVDFPLT